MNLTVIIPAYKETDNIEILIDKINKNLKDPYIILIDDSPDNSIEKIIKIRLENYISDSRYLERFRCAHRLQN